MQKFIKKNSIWLWWLIPIAVIGVVIGIESDWGREWRKPDAGMPLIEPKTVPLNLMQDYKLEGDVTAYVEMVNRPLLTPTRRPAPPPPPPEPPKQVIQRGQFALLGTTITKDKNIAFLRQASSGKFHRVEQGQVLNGMTVAKVAADRVTLQLGEDSEEIVMRIATATTKPPPSQPPTPTASTSQPVNTAMPTQPGGIQTAPVSAVFPSSPEQAVSAASPSPISAQTLEERRRAARAAAGGSTPPSDSKSDWNAVFERMRQQKQSPPKAGTP